MTGPRWTVVVVALLLIYMAVPARGQEWFELPGSSGTAVAQEDGEVKFHRAVLKAAAQAAKDGKIERAKVFRLRVAMLSPAFRKRAMELAKVQMAASDSEAIGSDALPVDENGKLIEAAIDWDKLASFLERLLPILLQLLEALSYDEPAHLPPVAFWLLDVTELRSAANPVSTC